MDEGCRVLCSIELKPEETNKFVSMIKDEYTVHMWANHTHFCSHCVCMLYTSYSHEFYKLTVYRIADNLPAASVFRNLKTDQFQYEDGYKLGFVLDKLVALNNHLTIVIKYHAVER